MSTPLEYGWRTESLRMAHGGVFVLVEKFWCTEAEGDADGWRWSGFVGGPNSDSHSHALVSNTMSREAATAAAEKWLADQIERANELAVYRFAGLEAAP